MREAVLEPNPFTLCCVTNNLPFPESRDKAKMDTCAYSAEQWLLFLWCLHKVFQRIIFSPCKHSKKDYFQGSSVLKNYRKSSDERKSNGEILILLKLTGIVRPKFCLEFYLRISLEYRLCASELWNCTALLKYHFPCVPALFINDPADFSPS